MAIIQVLDSLIRLLNHFVVKWFSTWLRWCMQCFCVPHSQFVTECLDFEIENTCIMIHACVFKSAAGLGLKLIDACTWVIACDINVRPV